MRRTFEGVSRLQHAHGTRPPGAHYTADGVRIRVEDRGDMGKMEKS